MITKFPSHFTANDRTPFTYCITHVPTGNRYYGSRYAKGCKPEDLWTIYFTSSQNIHELLTKDGSDAFSVQIRKIFDSKENCQKFETKLLQKLDLAAKSNWINKTNGGSSNFSF